jgi:hypothetical protein
VEVYNRSIAEEVGIPLLKRPPATGIAVARVTWGIVFEELEKLIVKLHLMTHHVRKLLVALDELVD